MASASQSILNLATTTAPTLNFQIPQITMKPDRTNYPLWRTTIVATLEAFDLEDYVWNPQPPTETIIVPAVAAVPAIDSTLTVAVVPPTSTPNPDYVFWKKRDRYVLLWLKSKRTDKDHALVACSNGSNPQ